MSHILTQYGEEYVLTENVDGATLTVGLYNDGTDDISDGDDMAAISTEPDNANYATDTDTFSVENTEGTTVGANNDSELTFDFEDQTATQIVDSYYVSVEFQSDVLDGEGAASEHLLYTGALSQDRDIGSIDILNLATGSVELLLE